MDANEFRRTGYEMIDYVADFMDNINKRDPMPNCEPGYMRDLIPPTANEKPESWEQIMSDIEPVIMKGMTHWNHPHFHAYFPSGNSWPSILGGILCNTFACNSASWEACPAATELEIIVLDWCAKFLGLPEFFYSKFSNPTSAGGGCIQTSASECVFISLIAARELALLSLKSKDEHKNKKKTEIKSLVVAYGSAESHSCFDKACIMADVRVRLIRPDARGKVRAQSLKKKIEEDLQKGYHPFFYNAILGSTSTCAFDDLVQLGPICQQFDLWLHADAAYAGSSFCCPEMRHLCEGLEFLSSFNTNANKLMLTSFDCSLYWLKDKSKLTTIMSGNDFPHENSNNDDDAITDFRHWGIPMTRRFRALKLWCTIRTYGVNGIRDHIRNHIQLAKTFDSFVKRDIRFETVGLTQLGLCSFRLKGDGNKADNINASLLEALNSTHKIHMIPSSYLGKYIIRFAICSNFTTEADIEVAWAWISDYAEVLLRIAELQNEELDDNNNNETGELFHLARRWKKYHKRPINIQVVEQIKEYYQKKSNGVKDFLAESTSKPAGSLASTADLKYLSDNQSLLLPATSKLIDNHVFTIIQKESSQPEETVVDSSGSIHHVAGHQFDVGRSKIQNFGDSRTFWE